MRFVFGVHTGVVADEVTLEAVIRPQIAPVDRDRVLADLAERQHGVLAHRQLLDA